MPSTLFPTMERPHTDEVGLENQEQTLQMALNLSMLGLQHVHSEDEGSLANTYDENSRRSSNMTECVPVPSSEHVAEIVGRQGCKIKALRAKTNTYIKTPVRGEDPIFVVTGRKEDVAAAKREILSAADHFSQIRARRNNQVHGAVNGTTGAGGGGVNGSLTVPNLPGQTTIHVKVPYRVVGLVVGPKGSTVKRIQQQTNTYIITPSRDNQPVFVVTGMPENVERAREEIEAHIALRTGGLIDSSAEENDFASNGTDTGLFSHRHDSSVFKPPPSTTASISALTNIFNPMVGGKNDQPRANGVGSESNYFFPNTNGTSNGSTKLNEFNPLPSFPTNGFLFNDCPSPDLGIDSPGFDLPGLQSAGNQSLWQDLTRCSLGLNPVTTQHQAPRRSSSVSTSAPTSGVDANANEHPPARRIRSDPLEGGLSALPSFVPLSNANAFASSNSAGSHGSSCSSPTDSLGSSSAAKKSKECVVCFTSEVVAALVPCGHNMFCMDCANRLVETTDGECPVCQTVVTQAIRIFT
ncbi:RNA-binding protein MEX3B-like [Patiria miniata]|uniref:RING-type domain-containing protein n=1 Tax=Patiria miniata TaxID=46514 RepID=A0A914BFE6_PATMI|nr:RNA-binding protein MEX3B-like [Patiria miniata]